jgi:hypothetical protein
MSEKIKTAGIIKYYKRLKKSNPLIDILLFVITVTVLGVLVYLLKQQNKKDPPSNDVGPGTVAGPGAVAGPGVNYELDQYLSEIASYKSRYENDKSDINKQLLENQINECMSKYSEYACRGGEEMEKRRIDSEVAELERKLAEELAQAESQKRAAQQERDRLQLELIEKKRETANKRERLKEEKGKLQALKHKEVENASKDPKYNYEILEGQHYGNCIGKSNSTSNYGCMLRKGYGWGKSDNPMEVKTEDECAELCNNFYSFMIGQPCKGYSYKFAQHPVRKYRNGKPRGSCYLTWNGISEPSERYHVGENEFWITRKKI